MDRFQPPVESTQITNQYYCFTKTTHACTHSVTSAKTNCKIPRCIKCKTCMFPKGGKEAVKKKNMQAEFKKVELYWKKRSAYFFFPQ